jgi:hypothetical protein
LQSSGGGVFGQLAAADAAKSRGIERLLMQAGGGTVGGQVGQVGHDVKIKVY